VKLTKSGGVVNRDKTFRKQLQIKRIKEYFYGTPRLDLSPFTTTISFSDISVRRIDESTLAPESALPIGAERKVEENSLLHIEIGDLLLHTVLAVSSADLMYNATPADEAILLESNISGFVYVSEVDEKKRRIKILSPCPGKLPKRYLWLGSLRWMEM
jgi:polyribonucleotide 5'-hydroxyl-kinase